MPYWTDLFTPECATWLWEKMNEAGAKGYVVGISGGIDSAVAARLAVMGVGRDGVMGLLIPARLFGNTDLERSREVVKWLDISWHEIDLGNALAVFQHALAFQSSSKEIVGNLKARFRMCALYYYANAMNHLVLGTSNKTELELGYFTKYGDGGADVEPIGDVYKTGIVQLATDLEVPEAVIKAAPSAGLWEGQTDEEEIGYPYSLIDKVLQKGGTWREPLPGDAVIAISKMQRASEHKRRMPPIFKWEPPYK